MHVLIKPAVALLSLALLASAHIVGATGSTSTEAEQSPANVGSAAAVAYRTVRIDGLDIFYREAGVGKGPTILLLHGFPTSSQMFRNLIPQLADRYHVIAPDYPGFGQSAMPLVSDFDYSFDHLAAVIDRFTQAVGADRFALYVQDYGAPIGFRIAAAHPGRITALVIQNGNAYEEGLDNDFWAPIKAYWADRSEARASKLRPLFEIGATKWQYTEGIRDVQHISPDAWTVDQAYLDRPGNKEIQLQLFYSYGSNPGHYAEWQTYFRKSQPPALIVWGKNDKIFPPAGASPYLRDLPKAELHLLDTGHFALEEDSATIAALMRDFLDRNVRSDR